MKTVLKAKARHPLNHQQLARLCTFGIYLVQKRGKGGAKD